jgi:hypothetical protein
MGQDVLTYRCVILLYALLARRLAAKTTKALKIVKNLLREKLVGSVLSCVG